ncbi:galanin receptor type 2-like [Watersipora subatra]|uniref:galanin receptor type 2-like n=1 Tax=Watersipora subatra TaxID=2589382 RepID=UPI00355C0400
MAANASNDLVLNFIQENTEGFQRETMNIQLSAMEATVFESYFVIATVVGVSLNILTIIALIFGENVSKKVKIQLINLAVADTIFASLYLPWLKEFYLRRSFINNLLQCITYYLMAQSAMHASVLCNAAISLERVVVICFPFRAKGYTKSWKFGVVTLIWLCAALPEIATIYFFKMEPVGDVNICSTSMDKFVLALVEFSKYCFSAVIITVSYLVVLAQLCKRKRNHKLQRTRQEDSQRTGKLLVMLSVDAFLTMLTWLSSSSLEIYQHLNGQPLFTNTSFVYDVCLEVLFTSNAFTTPIVYMIFNGYFRKDVWLVLKKPLLWCKQRET